MRIVNGQHRLLLQYVEYFEVRFVGRHHELFHVVAESKTIDLIVMLLIGLQDEFIAQLNDLNAACLLSTQDYVAVLTHLDGCHYILELEYLLDGFQRIRLFIM